MGLIHPGLPQSLVTALQDRIGSRVLVETGTHIGSSSLWASDKFDRVITIERSEALYNRAKQTLANVNNVEVILGRSELKLPAIVASLRAPAIFWLDAHWSAEDTAGEDDQCPVILEIEAVDTVECEHVILIDDARLFLNAVPPPLNQSHWPTYAELSSALRQKFPHSYISVFDDVIVRVPGRLRDELEAITRSIRAPPPPHPAAGGLWSWLRSKYRDARARSSVDRVPPDRVGDRALSSGKKLRAVRPLANMTPLKNAAPARRWRWFRLANSRLQ
jgi:hypothetical protein